ncbi:Ethanolamine kinase 1, partial [Ophiophagus hannah]
MLAFPEITVSTHELGTRIFTDGITNKLIGCYVDEKMDDVVLVRIYGNKTELLVDREEEVKSFRVLQAHGCAPQLYCTFSNGLCYEFMQGEALDPEHSTAEWNTLAGIKGHSADSQHSALTLTNFIFVSRVGDVQFIDYEYSGYNYLAYDIGNHFNEFAGVSEVDYNLYPSRKLQEQWLRSYLEAYKEYKGFGTDVTAKEVEVLYVQVNQFALASHFFWGLWALIQAKYSTIDFDFLGIISCTKRIAAQPNYLLKCLKSHYN